MLMERLIDPFSTHRLIWHPGRTLPPLNPRYQLCSITAERFSLGIPIAVSFLMHDRHIGYRPITILRPYALI